ADLIGRRAAVARWRDGVVVRDLEAEGRPPSGVGGDAHASPERHTGGVHRGDAGAAPRDGADARLGRDLPPQQDFFQFRLRLGDHAALERTRTEPLPIDTAAVVADLDHDLRARVLDAEADLSALGLAQGAALVGRLDAVVDGVPQ